MDWVAHLEYLQVVQKKFNDTTATSKNLLICYFRDNLRPSIRAQIDKRDRNLEYWLEVIKRTIDAKAKAG